jgi:hypothetical protein
MEAHVGVSGCGSEVRESCCSSQLKVLFSGLLVGVEVGTGVERVRERPMEDMDGRGGGGRWLQGGSSAEPQLNFTASGKQSKFALRGGGWPRA